MSIDMPDKNIPDSDERCKSAHTPGPWEALSLSIDGKQYPIVGVGFRDGERVSPLIGYVIECHDDSQGAGNARVVAAAPELLAALKQVLIDDAPHCSRVDHGQCLTRRCALRGGYPGSGGYDPAISTCPVFEAESAIAKAEGREWPSPKPG